MLKLLFFALPFNLLIGVWLLQNLIELPNCLKKVLTTIKMERDQNTAKRPGSWKEKEVLSGSRLELSSSFSESWSEDEFSFESVPCFFCGSETGEGRSIGGNGIGPEEMWLGPEAGGGIKVALVGTVDASFSAAVELPIAKGPGRLGNCTPT